MVMRLKLFFAQLFLLISSVSTEQSQTECEEYSSLSNKNGETVLAGQSDPLFEPTSSLMKTPTLSTDDHAQEDLLQKYQGTSGKAVTTRSVDQVLY